MFKTACPFSLSCRKLIQFMIPFYFSKMHFNTIIKTKSVSSKWFFPYKTCEMKTGDFFKISVTVTPPKCQYIPPTVAPSLMHLSTLLKAPLPAQ